MGFFTELAIAIIQRTNWERLLFPEPDKTKYLANLSSIAINQAPVETAIPTEGLSTEETVKYQKREIGKLLLQMERHFSQRMRIAGIPCDCGASKHLLDMEALSEETIPMEPDNPLYSDLLIWIRQVGSKSTEQAAKSGQYDEEYPKMAEQARNFRKKLLGTLDAEALFATVEEKEAVLSEAHKILDEMKKGGSGPKVEVRYD